MRVKQQISSDQELLYFSEGNKKPKKKSHARKLFLMQRLPKS